MKIKPNKLFCLGLMLCLCLLLSGCFTRSAEELYSLPQLSDEYVQLQSEIDKILNAGAEYSAPTSGSYRQAVQFEDLNGDETKEAIAFFSAPGDDMPLKIYIFEREDETYRQAVVIEGAGTDIRSVDYTDMDGDGVCEVVAGWQIAAGVSMLSAYSLKDYQVVQLFSADYTNYTICDMSTSQGTDVLVAGSITPDHPGEAYLYSLMPDSEIVTSTARLSAGILSVTTVKTGNLSDGKQGVFIESLIDENSTVTDVLAYKNKTLVNASLRALSGVSQGTVRTYNAVTPADIDGDGVMEVPNPVQLNSDTDTAKYWIIEWYAYDSSGYKNLKETTYHNFSDGWYLTLPGSWSGRITVRRDATVSGERTLIFSYLDGSYGRKVDFLAIYALSGENKEERAKLPGRVVLMERSNVIYAEEILTTHDTVPLTLNDKVIINGFNIIYSEFSA